MNRFLFWFSVVCFALGLVCCFAGHVIVDWYAAAFYLQAFLYYLGLSGFFCFLLRPPKDSFWEMHGRLVWILLAVASVWLTCSVDPK